MSETSTVTFRAVSGKFPAGLLRTVLAENDIDLDHDDTGEVSESEAWYRLNSSAAFEVMDSFEEKLPEYLKQTGEKIIYTTLDETPSIDPALVVTAADKNGVRSLNAEDLIQLLAKEGRLEFLLSEEESKDGFMNPEEFKYKLKNKCFSTTDLCILQAYLSVNDPFLKRTHEQPALVSDHILEMPEWFEQQKELVFLYDDKYYAIEYLLNHGNPYFDKQPVHVFADTETVCVTNYYPV